MRRLDERPEIPDWAVMFWRAFVDLSADRQITLGLGPIPWSSLDRWALRHGVSDADDFEELVQVVRALDGIYLDEHEKRKPKPPPKPGPRPQQ